MMWGEIIKIFVYLFNQLYRFGLKQEGTPQSCVYLAYSYQLFLYLMG